MKRFIPRTLLWILLAAAGSGLPFRDARAQDAQKPPVPTDSTKFVWIRLPSGEWLAGSIESLRDETFEFDSEELDNLTFDWDDIKELRSPQVLTMRFDVLGDVTGTMHMVGDSVFVQAGQGLRVYPRSLLLSIISGTPTEWNYWSAKASLGLVTRRGNTNQNDLNAAVFLRRETPDTRLDLDYRGNFGDVSETTTINNHSINGELDWLVSSGYFVTPIWGNLLKDEFQNVELRSTIGAGVGYFLVRKKRIEWSINFGAGYQSTTYLSVEAGTDRVQQAGILVPATKLDMDITGSLDLVVDYNAQVGFGEPRNAFHHSSAYFSLDALGDILEFTLSVTWDHTTNPQAAEDGTIPKKDDVRTAFGIGIDL